MTGINLTGPRRSQLLEQLLARQAVAEPNIRSGLELALKLGAQGIRQRGINQLSEQEAAQQQALVEALNAGRATSGQAVALESVEGPREQVFIPGKKADPSARADALSQLPPEQQALAAQLMGLQKEAQDPSQFEQRQILQDSQQKAASERLERQLDAANERAGISADAELRKLQMDYAQRDKELTRKLEAQELSQVRDIQAKAALLDKKIQSATGAMNIGTPEERLSAGYAARMESAHNTINELGGDFTGTLSPGRFAPNMWKSGDRQRYEQAKRNFINAVLRRESGAAIAQSEFDNADQQYFPGPGDGEDVIAQKAQNRRESLEALRLSAGPAYEVLKSRLGEEPSQGPTSSQQPQYSEGQTATNPDTGERLVFRNGQWVKR